VFTSSPATLRDTKETGQFDVTCVPAFPFREARAPCTSYLIGQQRPQSMPQSRTKSRTNLLEKWSPWGSTANNSDQLNAI